MQSLFFDVSYLKDTAGYLFSKGLVSKWNLLQKKKFSLHEEEKKRVNNICKIEAALIIYFWKTLAYSREKYKYIYPGGGGGNNPEGVGGYVWCTQIYTQ